MQNTLKDTKDELEHLIRQLESLKQALATSDRDLSVARKTIFDLKRDLDDRNH
jgi:hypothetical protein